MIELSQGLDELEWIPRPKILALRRLGIETAEDLLTHYPRRYEDRHEFPHFPREESDTAICLCGEVVKTSLRRFGGWKKIFEATLEESNSNALSQPLTLRWFNLHYVQKMIATGQRLVVFGKPRQRGHRLCMEHPEFEVIENDEERSIHFRPITPVYPAAEGISQRLLRGTIYRILRELNNDAIETLLPAALTGGDAAQIFTLRSEGKGRLKICSTTRTEALRAIHFPEDGEALEAAREHLVLSEFFAMQMLIASRRMELSQRLGKQHCGPGKLLDKFLGALPFELTSAQMKVIGEIRHDLASRCAMNRLLQGDVGSGKTVVAVAALLLAVEAGFQTALMAPTQILAEQHYDVLRFWLEPLGVRLSLRTAARREESGALPLFAGVEAPCAKILESTGCQPVVSGCQPDTSARASGPNRKFEAQTRKTSRQAASKSAEGFRSDPRNRGVSEPIQAERFAASCREQPRKVSGCSPEMNDPPQVIIGTHALLYEGVSFSDLGLVVIDEQHKFGVAQRARLTNREPAPDVLVMTATPIPRTLTMTVYGDLDVSTIDEMPGNRGKIITVVREQNKLGEVLNFIQKELAAGRQAYVIYPLIDQSEKLDVKAAAKEFEQWQERLRPYRCELLHGRITAGEKQETMERFRRGKTQVLISTTVIEVGIDVPNASVMLIENAERFGLAQMHQLRGRIGRGEHKSYCILLTSEKSAETWAKLAVLERTNNGFEVAEADWNMRGPGDLLGTAQSGLPALRIGDLKRDAELMRRARNAAMSIFERDPLLEWPENQRFRRLIVEEQGRTFSHVS